MDTYKFIGHQHGHLTDENGEIRNYATVFATIPVGGSREGYQAAGLKSCNLTDAGLAYMRRIAKRKLEVQASFLRKMQDGKNKMAKISL